MDKYYDGAIVSVDDVLLDFDFDNRNDFFKRTSYISKDGKFIATVYDGDKQVLIERTY